MSAMNDADGLKKSMSVLGDVTNRIGKRGFSETEKSGVKSYNLNDKDTVKHVRVSPRRCTELGLLKGDVLSKVSNVVKGLSVQDLESRSIDIETELACGYGNSEEINGKDAVKLSEKKADSPYVNPMFVVDNRSVDTPGDMSSSVHDALTMIDKIRGRNSKDPCFSDLEIGSVINSLDSKAGGCLPFGERDSLKGYMMLEIPNAGTENTSPNLTGTVKSNVVDVTRNSSGNVASRITKISTSSYLNLLDLGRGNAFRCANTKAKNKLGDICSANTSSIVSETGNDHLLDCINCDAGETKVSLEGTQKNLVDYLYEVEGHNADTFIMSQSDSIDCAMLPDSQESRIFGVEKSSEPKKGKECPYVGGVVDAIKTCSCSFCTKAAYIWLDLNYQDIKGRVSAMRKSQKEASILAKRSMIKETEGSTRMSKLEIDLMLQWNFLFQHMAAVWEQEGDHLETSLLPLTDLREKCKRDLGSD